MNVPKLRFKEFNDEWQNIDLKNVFEYFSTNSLSRDQLSNSGIIKNIHYGDIHRKYSAIVDVDNDVETYIKDINYNNKYEYCKDSDLIFADASEDYEGIGKVIELNNIKCNTVSGLHTILARDKQNLFAPMFKGYYFNSPSIHNQIRILANGFKVYGISKDSINKLNINIPTKEEQSKIARTLYLLDKKIELQTKKIEDLKLFKLCTAKIIFKDNSLLCKKQLKELCNIVKGKQINSEFLSETGEYYMLNGGINPSGFINEYNTNENTISISEGGNSCGYVNFNKSKFWAGGHCYTITPIDINNIYLYQILKYNENKIMDLRVGSGLPNIQKKDLENFSINVHRSNMQNKIATILSSIDKLIDLEEKKINNIEKLKKGLMQNMFV